MDLVQLEAASLIKPGFPEFIDSTMLTNFRSCPQSFYRQFGTRKIAKEKSIHLIAGGAFAKGLEVARRCYYDGGMSAEDSEAEGVIALLRNYQDIPGIDYDHNKHFTRLVEAFVRYFQKWPLDTDFLRPVQRDGKSWVEFSFSLPTNVMHPETGQPILFVGRCDMIGRFNNSIYTEDDKTCKAMGPKWQDQWEMRGQFIGYVHAAREHGFNVVGAITRGIKLAKTEIEFGQSIIQIQPWQVARWVEQLERDLERMKRCYATGIWDWNYGDACSGWGGCQYKQLCTSPNPEPFIDIYYEDYTWNPLSKGDEE